MRVVGVTRDKNMKKIHFSFAIKMRLDTNTLKRVVNNIDQKCYLRLKLINVVI